MFDKLAARAFLFVTGWRAVGAAPEASRYVLLLAPHTSNWDFWFMLATTRALGVRGQWFGKRSIFRFPVGFFARRLGGLPIDRAAPHGVVGAVADRFAEADHLVVAIQPEGTRARAEHWKSGFYQIAREAGVPICLLSLDYARRRGELGPCLRPSGDRAADMDVIRRYYADKTARYPAQFGPVRLADESPAGAPPEAKAG